MFLLAPIKALCQIGQYAPSLEVEIFLLNTFKPFVEAEYKICYVKV